MEKATVFIVDDDTHALCGISKLLERAGYEVRSFESVSAFLINHDPSLPGCIVLDVCMPEMHGLDLQRLLVRQGVTKPVIFLTGLPNVRETVDALKMGAVDFLVKPAERGRILRAVAEAVEKDAAIRAQSAVQASIERRLETLTCRERQVLAYVVAGCMNKQIATELGTAVKTIKVHRARMMAKMSVRTVAELVRIVERAPVPAIQHRFE